MVVVGAGGREGVSEVREKISGLWIRQCASQ